VVSLFFLILPSTKKWLSEALQVVATWESIFKCLRKECPTVFSIPLLSPDYCRLLIDEMRNVKKFVPLARLVTRYIVSIQSCSAPLYNIYFIYRITWASIWNAWLWTLYEAIEWDHHTSRSSVLWLSHEIEHDSILRGKNPSRLLAFLSPCFIY